MAIISLISHLSFLNYLQRFLHDLTPLVDNREVFAHIPDVPRYQCLQLQTDICQRSLEFIVVLRLYLLLLAFGHHIVEQLLRHLKLLFEIVKRLLALLQFLTVVVHIAQVLLDDDALSC